VIPHPPAPQPPSGNSDEELRDSVVLAQVQKIMAEIRHGGRAESPELDDELPIVPCDRVEPT
jgi:hypothetical protein